MHVHPRCTLGRGPDLTPADEYALVYAAVDVDVDVDVQRIGRHERRIDEARRDDLVKQVPGAIRLGLESSAVIVIAVLIDRWQATQRTT